MPAYTFRFDVIENVTAVSRNIQKSFDQMSGSANRFVGWLNRAPNPLNKLKGAMPGVGSAIAGAFAVDKLVSFGSSVVSTLAEFEKYEAVLANTFGDKSAAKQVLADITDFAAKTPFQVDELTNSFVKLANRGFVPNMEQMAMLGDLASSTGKDFDMLAEAILDAETGEFERLKEFGIKASKEGKRVMLSFKGITKEVENSPEAIRAALLELAKEAPGVAGSMDAIMGTTAGMLSNLGDVWKMLQLSIGEALAPLIHNLLPKIILGLSKFGEWVKKNEEGILKWAPRIAAAAAAFAGLIAVGMGISAIGSAVAVVGTVIGALLSPIAIVVAGVAAAAYVIINHWETVKGWLATFEQWAWNLNPFKWVLDLVERVFPGFRKALAGLWEYTKMVFKAMSQYIYESFIKPIGKFFAFLFKWQGKGAGEGLPDAEPETGEGAGEGEKKDPGVYDRMQAAAGGTGAKPSAGVPGSSSAGSGGSISGSGGAGKNVTININKLIEQLVIQTSSLQESRSRIREEVTRALVDAVNDVNYAN